MSKYSHKALLSSLFKEDLTFRGNTAKVREGLVDKADYTKLMRRVRFGPNDPSLHDMTPLQRARFLRTYRILELRFAARHRNFFIRPNFRPILTPGEKMRAKRRIQRARRQQEKEFQRRLKALGGMMTVHNFMPTYRFPTYRLYIENHWRERIFKSKERVYRRSEKFNRKLELIELFMGIFLRHGKRTKAVKFFRAAIAKIRRSRFYRRNRRRFKSPLTVIFKALRIARPRLILKTKRIGSVYYRLPSPVLDFRRQSSMGIRWLYETARSRPERSLSTAFAKEIVAIHKDVGGTLQRKEALYRIATGNIAFARELKKKMEKQQQKKGRSKALLRKIKPR